jgi:hypothetical protein
LDANKYRSYTIQYLTPGTEYFVRVFATNNYGLGIPGTSTPKSVAPALQVPGRPHTVAAYSGDPTGSIRVTWQRPRIPYHGIPCSGLNSAPNDCPTPIGGTLAQSDGGSTITEYVVEYNELEDFSGYDYGEVVTTKNVYTFENLTPGRKYYIRVLARNAMGSGQFCAFKEPNCNIVSTEVSATATS